VTRKQNTKQTNTESGTTSLFFNSSLSDNYTSLAGDKNPKKQIAKLNTTTFVVAGGGSIVFILLVILFVNVLKFCRSHTKVNCSDDETEHKPMESHYQTIDETTMVPGGSALPSGSTGCS
jgi:hypothetical protein